MEHDVAIVGMACIFPKAPDLASFWRNVRDGVDAISDVPAGRWDPLYYDPASTAPDRFYAKRGGFIDEYAQFDAASFGIMPIAAQGAEPDQLLALQVAVAALADAGYADRPFPRARTDVVVGRGNYLGPAMLRLVNITRGAQQLVETVQSLVPGVTAAELEAVKHDFQQRCGVYGADTAIGLVPNLAASRIANRLDLGGAAYTVDAACASALVAVDHACRALGQGSAELVIAGGVHLCHDPVFWSVFSQLGALSRSQQIRPFDRHADGLLIGEGLGMVVLKRAVDAQRDGDRVYAVIRGIGVASDGRDVSLMTPRVEGQLLALERAWTASGLAPATLGLLEAHGTGTPAGDAAELATLGRFFGPPPGDGTRVPLGSVKSMIGHAMPASGAAGLIKAALAVYHGVRPPTLHCAEPSAALAATRFRAIGAAEPWDAEVRRAAVNSFGFGGINVHLILDSQVAPAHARSGAAATATDDAPAPEVFVAAAPTAAALAAAVLHATPGGTGGHRISIVSPTPERCTIARAAIASGRARRGRDGIHFAPGGLIAEGGKTVFLFPGVEAQFAPEVASLAAHFGLTAPDVSAPDLEHQGYQVLQLSRFLLRVAKTVGLKADLVGGHSIGEWSAMIAAGIFEESATDAFTASLQPGSAPVADVRYVAAGAGRARIEALCGDIPDVALSHDNCDHQAILCVPEHQVDAVTERLRGGRVLHEVLPFRSGFHSSALTDHVAYYVRNLAKLPFSPARLPLWSATTCAPYPSDPDAIRALFGDHLTKPVRFRELVHALYADGARVFVQMGIGSLPAFVDDVLAGKPHLAVSLLTARHSGLAQFRRACAALFVEGLDLDLARAGLVPAGNAAASGRAMPLELGVALVRTDLAGLRRHPGPGSDAGAGGGALAQVFAAGMRDIAAAQDDVMRAFARVGSAPPVPVPAAASLPDPAAVPERTDRIVLSLETYPELVDHALVPQPPGWPHVEDGMPAVPMTMSIELIREAALRLAPGRLAIAVEAVQAKAWLRAVPPVEAAVVARRIAPDRIHVRIDGYFEGTVVLGDRYPLAPAPARHDLGAERDVPLGVPEIYTDGWLFHGPRYQGIVAIDAFGTTGARGTLRALAAKGALLDSAGQLPGLHLALTTTKDRLALPVRITRVEYFGDTPAPGTLLTCDVAMRHVGRHEMRADFDVLHDGRVHLRVHGWTDWRFQTENGLWELMRAPGKALLSTCDPRGFTWICDPGWTSATADYLTRRYISAAESRVPGDDGSPPRDRRRLLGRIAAKDAVRAHLFALGHDSLYPVEVAIMSDASGRPTVGGSLGTDVRVSIAHSGEFACALAAQGYAPGIDVESIAPRGEGFASLAFSERELALVPVDARDEWLTRLWAAKEAVGKARGTGLAGQPKALRINNVEGELVQVEDRWVATTKLGDRVIAWTMP